MKKILLIGDSICQGYRNFVKIAFKDTAEVYFPQENCRLPLMYYAIFGIGKISVDAERMWA